MPETFLGLILARGGSKGIPKKNLKFMNGKPLLAYSVEAANQSKYIERIVLSTDDQEIAEVGRKYGAEVPFMRPAELATDIATSMDAILHALKWLQINEDYWPTYTVLLQPTSPLRTAEDLDNAVEELKNLKADSLVSLCKADKHPYWQKKIVDNLVVPYTKEGLNITRRQDLPEVYNLNGAIFIAKSALLIEQRSWYVGKTVPYIMPKERSIDLDDMMDWRLTEIILREREKSDETVF